MIDERAARAALKERIVDDVIWIRGKFNLADAMPKAPVLPQFVKA